MAIAAHLTSNQSSTSNIAVRGNCNRTVTNSSGGTYILNCTLANPTIEQANLFYLIIGFTAAAPPLGGMINWQFVDKSNSDITISIDGRQVVYEDLNTIFSDETMKIPRGQHTFTIETNFVYYPSPTGVQAPPASASCTALLDVQAPGKIYPQLLLQQDFNGGLAPVRCGFNI
ncbi:hypothetical protein ACSPAH_12505 [Buttiauxella agrestis]